MTLLQFLDIVLSSICKILKRLCLIHVDQLAITVGITLAYLCGMLVDWRLLAAFGMFQKAT